jgi:site-specific DNA-methyltransferase (adenine-specific)
VDAIITDLPYGTTACKWDTIIPFNYLWDMVRHVLKPRGAFVTTASQPFTSALVMSNPKWFKYEWIWQKEQGTGFQVAKYRPMIEHENVLVFGDGKINYHPMMEKLEKPQRQKRNSNNGNSQSSPLKYSDVRESVYTSRHPTSIKKFLRDKGLHPTQKPVALYEYLIKTYTNEGDTVLDLCMGSGTTGVACKNTGRNFIGIEKELQYFEIAKKRLEEA